jgi:plasmid maintenance system antidote protein VapI
MKRNIMLPKEYADMFKEIKVIEERDTHIRALRQLGWTYSSMADALGVSRERIRQICSTTDADSNAVMVPNPPYHKPKSPRVFVEPTPDALARLLELQPMAQQVRANAPRFRKEAEEYTALVNKVHAEDGVTLYRLAKCLGVTHSALRFRLARYGYKAPANGATSKSYKPVIQSNRAI